MVGARPLLLVEQMKSYILSLLAGAALSGLAVEPSPAAKEDGEQAMDGKLLDRRTASNNGIDFFLLVGKKGIIRYHALLRLFISR